MSSSSLTTLPLELILDHLLPLLPVPALAALACTSKHFAALTADPLVWQRRLLADFNFNGNETARTTGWKDVYRRMRRMRVYVWGESSKRRLGMSPRELPRSSVPDGVPFPVRLRFPREVEIVGLVAGGMSFHALDSKGNLYVWGTLDGTSWAMQADGFSEPAKVATRPLRLDLPFAIRTVSCARLHTAVLTTNAQVLTFPSWGRPFLLRSSHFSSSPPVQVECGWDFTAVLTAAGDVFVYWPRASSPRPHVHGDLAHANAGAPRTMGRLGRLVWRKNRQFDDMAREAVSEEEKAEGKRAKAHEREDGSIGCWVWSVDCERPDDGLEDSDEDAQEETGEVLVRLPDLPTYDLPDLRFVSFTSSTTATTKAESPKLVKIAGLDCQLVGLTNGGHVVRYRGLDNEETAGRRGGLWEYLPGFCEAERVKAMDIWDSEGRKKPDEVKITHISGHFKTFTAYATGTESVVLMGNIDQDPVQELPLPSATSSSSGPYRTHQDFQPTVLPSVGSPIIAVTHGDYHSGALTAEGKLFTWGKFSKGALGLGDPVDLPVGEEGGFANERQRAAVRESMVTGVGALVEPSAVRTPREVRFDWEAKRKGKGKDKEEEKEGRETYCFAATAGGWHMGALVVDLEPGGEDSDEEEEEEEDKSVGMPGAFPSGSAPGTPAYPGTNPASLGLGPLGPFRIGFAGRGMRHTMPGGGGLGQQR